MRGGLLDGAELLEKEDDKAVNELGSDEED